MNANEPHDGDEQDARTDGGPSQGLDRSDRESEQTPGDALASLDDFVHKRDGDGELLPVVESLPGGEKKVRVYPLTQGDANEYLPDNGDPLSLDDDEILELLKEFYETPDFSGVESLDEVVAFGLDPLIMALMNASGFDMATDMISDTADLQNTIQGNSSRGS